MGNFAAQKIIIFLMDRFVKTLLFILYPIIAVCMAAATVIEKYKGTDFVSDNIYGSWWFSLLWALLLVCGIVWIVRRRMRRFPLLLVHGGFAVVLVGACVTHLTRWQGRASLRCGTEGSSVTVVEGKGKGGELALPFTVRLNGFDVKTHAGSDDPYDYVSRLTLTDAAGSVDRDVTMNHPVKFHGITIMQSGYDSDGLGSVLSFSSDPVGTPVTYGGYAVLFAGVLSMLFGRRSTFGRLLGSKLLRELSLVVAAVLTAPLTSCGAEATDMPPTLTEATASDIGRLLVSHNGRVCPLQTYALDFTRKLYGSSSYRGLSAEQVLTGWMFWPDRWAGEPFIKTGRELRNTLMLPSHVSFNQLFNRDMGGYILGPYIREYYGGNHDKFHTDAAAVDDRLQLIVDLRRNASLKLFPLTADGKTRWYAPADDLPKGTGRGHRLFISNVLAMMQSDAVAGDEAGVRMLVSKLSALQQRDGGESLPSPLQRKAERVYNAVPFNTILFMVNLTFGFVLLFASLARVGRARKVSETPLLISTGGAGRHHVVLIDIFARSVVGRLQRVLPVVVMALSFAALTFFCVLRWIVSGTVPMANGFETMLFVAWTVMLLSLLLVGRTPIVLMFGFIMSGFFLLVSHISQMDPQITHVMPVLNSPLLSVHVSIIMFAFALLSMTFVCAVTALLVALRTHFSAKKATAKKAAVENGAAVGGAGANGKRILESYAVLSRLFLYPAITFLTIGIFVGAIWAERSWGMYWGWDPKETWALITLMVYAVPLHTTTVASLRRPMAYHVFMAFAFLAIIMTYFGVNYFLGGMHSYA